MNRWKCIPAQDYVIVKFSLVLQIVTILFVLTAATRQVYLCPAMSGVLGLYRSGAMFEFVMVTAPVVSSTTYR